MSVTHTSHATSVTGIERRERVSTGQPLIPVEDAKTLDGLFRERVKRTPELVAYRAYNEPHKNWREYTWAQIDRQVARWQAALIRDGLSPATASR